MIRTITVSENRRLTISSDAMGVVTENNAEILHFEFPVTINGEPISGYTKTVYFSDGVNKFNRPIQSDGTVKIDSGLTAKEQLTFWVEITGENFKWATFPYDIYFEFINADLPPAISLGDVQNSFGKNIGGDYSDKEFAELVGEQPDYNSGSLYELRAAYERLTTYMTNVAHTPYRTLNKSLEDLTTTTEQLKAEIVDCLNAILEPEEPYTSESLWDVLKQAIETLPEDVAEKIEQIVEEIDNGTY